MGAILVTTLLLCLQSVTPNYAKRNAPRVCWDSKRRASMCLENAVQFTPVVSEASRAREGHRQDSEQGASGGNMPAPLASLSRPWLCTHSALSICSDVCARLRLRMASNDFSHSFFQVPKGVCVHQNAEYQVSSELGGGREDGWHCPCLSPKDGVCVGDGVYGNFTSACSQSLDLQCIPTSARTVCAPTSWTTAPSSTSSPVPMCPATSPAAL